MLKMKGSLWEGGVRTSALIWSPWMQGKGVYNGLIHVTDWFATFITMAGNHHNNIILYSNKL